MLRGYAAEHNQPFDESLQAQTATIIDEATAIVGSHTMLFNLDNVIAFPQFQTCPENAANRSFVFLSRTTGLLS
jgi:hypothetical protein